jgi:SET domain-containing protein
MVKGFFAAGKDGGYWVPQGGLNSIDISFFLNHSKQPNVKIIGDGSNFVTARRIKKGEELTVAYNTFDAKFNQKEI